MDDSAVFNKLINTTGGYMERWFSNYSGMLSLIIFAVVGVFTVLVMSAGSSVLIPIIIAVAIWFALNGVTDMIQRRTIGGWQMPRALAMISAILLTFLLAIWVATVFVVNFTALFQELPTYTQNIRTLAQSIPEGVWSLLPEQYSADMSSGITDSVQEATGLFTNTISTLATSLTNIMTQGVLIAIYVLFLFTEQTVFGTKIRNMFPDTGQRSEAEEILFSIKEQTQTYISIKALVSLITAAVSLVIMLLFGLNHAMVWAILFFILNFIPNFGSIIAVAFPVIMAILQFGHLGTVAALLVLLFLVQMVIGYFVEPKMMGRSLNISPFVVLASLAIFGAIWGVTGMFLSVPLTVIVMIICSHFDATRPIAVLLSGDGYVHGVEMEAS